MSSSSSSGGGGSQPPALDVIKAYRDYISKMVTDVDGIKVLLLDEETVRVTRQAGWPVPARPTNSPANKIKLIAPPPKIR